MCVVFGEFNMCESCMEKDGEYCICLKILYLSYIIYWFAYKEDKIRSKGSNSIGSKQRKPTDAYLRYSGTGATS